MPQNAPEEKPAKESFDVWTEKYRPKTLSDFVGQEHLISKLRTFVEKRNIPHMLFAGPPGCGKTTAAFCMAADIFGTSWRSNFLELNASDERGIEIVRHKIKDFARAKPMGVPYKIVCLDEADALTGDAQHALRRTMEKYVETTRFILICNYSSRIIEPIQSRCAVFRFKQLAQPGVTSFLSKVAASENIEVENGALDAICRFSSGDMRRAINILQSAVSKNKVTVDSISKTPFAAHKEHIKSMILLALDGKFLLARDELKKLLGGGAAPDDILTELSNQIYDIQVTEQQRATLIDKLGEFEFRIARGGSPDIQFEALLAQFLLVKNS